MNNHPFLWDRFNEVPVVGILRGIPKEKIMKIIPQYISSGLSTIEMTMNSPSFKETMRFLTDNYGEDLNIGAGTVCTEDDLEIALSCKAGFIVSPIVRPEVIQRCKASGIPVFPGAYTPTEIYTARELGATMVKIFPSGELGPGYIKNLKAPLSDLKVLPTGGINKENFTAYIDAGADALGIGSGLFDKKCIEREGWEEMKKTFGIYVDYFKNRV